MKLLDKEKVVAEIKRLRERAYELYGCSQFVTAYDNVLKSIDSLVTKDVALKLDAVVMPSDSSFWVNREELTQFEDGDDVELLIVKK